MNFDFTKVLDNLQDGVSDAADTFHEKVNTFHENYISKVMPDFGKYGDAAKFTAELIPGVSEYNAIKDGDWVGFATAAGIDIAAFAVGGVTAGAGYAAIKGGSSAAKAGLKAATKEIAEAGAKKATKEITESGIKKVSKETIEHGTEKIMRETVEASIEKSTKEIVETGAEKVTKEIAKTGDKLDNAKFSKYHDGVEGISNSEIPANQTRAIEKNLKENKNIEHIKTIRMDLENKKYPGTEIYYRRKRFMVDGKIKEGVFPQFESKIDITLPKELFKATDTEQAKYCSEMLRTALESDSSLELKFNSRQLEQIRNGEFKISKLTWHHNEEQGKMQLVDAELHDKCRHIGGKSIWGGGKEYR